MFGLREEIETFRENLGGSGRPKLLAPRWLLGRELELRRLAPPT